jgi:hypothetical protein
VFVFCVLWLPVFLVFWVEIKNPRCKQRGIEDFSLKSLLNISPAPPVLTAPRGEVSDPKGTNRPSLAKGKAEPACGGIRPKPAHNNLNAVFLEKICAIAIGTVYGILRFFSPNFISASGFGISRYISAYIDYAALPVIIPLIACCVFSRIQKKVFHLDWTPDWTGFIILSLIPVILVSAVRWGNEKNPLLLVLIPVLWTSLAVAVHPLFNFIYKKPSLIRPIIGTAGFVLLSLLSAAVWQQFFIQENLIAFGLLAALLAPAVSVICFRLRLVPDGAGYGEF